MKQTPTVGRIVHFYTGFLAEQSNNNGSGPYAAIITRVWGDSMVNLTVFPDCGGELQHFTSVTNYLPEGVDAMQGRAWVWPPVIYPTHEFTDEEKAAMLTGDFVGEPAGASMPLVQISLETAQGIAANLRDQCRTTEAAGDDAGDDADHKRLSEMLAEVDSEIASRTA